MAIIANMVIESVYAVCITRAAIYFNNPWILWWYIPVFLCCGFNYKERRSTEKESEKENDT